MSPQLWLLALPRLWLLALPLVCRACTDAQRECVNWAVAGECAKNPGFMLHSCCASCAKVAPGGKMNADGLPPGVEAWEVENMEVARADSMVQDVDDEQLHSLATKAPACSGDDDGGGGGACLGPPTVIAWFYAPWCKQCKLVRAAFEEVAKRLSGHVVTPAHGPPAALAFARLDCVKWAAAKKRHEVSSYPTFKVLRGGRERWMEIPRNRSTEVLAELALREARGAFAWVHTEEEMRAALFDQLADAVDPKQFHVTGGGEALAVAVLPPGAEDAGGGGGSDGGGAAMRMYHELAAGCSVRASPMPFVATTDPSLLERLGLPRVEPGHLALVKLFSEPEAAPAEEQVTPRLVSTAMAAPGGSAEAHSERRLCTWLKAHRIPLLISFDADPAWGKRAGALSFVQVHCILILSAPHTGLASVVRAAAARFERGALVVMQLRVSHDGHEIAQNAMMKRYGVHTLLDTPRLVFLDQRIALGDGGSRQKPYSEAQITEEGVVRHLDALGLPRAHRASGGRDAATKDEL